MRSFRKYLFGSPSSKKGDPAFDWWTLPHIGSGVVLALLFAEGWVILALLVIYEAMEGLLRRYKTKSGGGVFEHESWPNIVADILVGMVPWLVVVLLFPGYDAPLRLLG